MRRRQLYPSFQSRGRGGGSRQEPSLALAFRALTNECPTCWASFSPPSTGPKSASQCRYVSEDLRDLQDCVSQLTPLVVLPEKCKCCRNWVCAKKSGRPTTTVDFDVGGGVSASCGGGGGAAVRSNLSPRPVLLFACPHKVSSAQS